MAILYGLQQADAGAIALNGETLQLRSPIDAIGHGIGMVHQGFKLFESLTVWENIVYRREPRRGPFIDAALACRQVAALSARYGLPIDPRAQVCDLPVGVRQRLEILKALYRQARILILDEPTAVLTPAEAAGLFDVMRTLSAAGCAILLVTHKLSEVMAVSHRITVLRDGRVTARMATADTSPAEIIRAMTGRNVALRVPEPAPALGPVRLAVDRLVVGGSGRYAVDEASFSIRGSEILGIAGVAGNGQSELVEALMGLREIAGGTVALDGRDITALPVAARRRAGMSYIAEDRLRTASAPAASATENLAMGFHRRRPLAVWNILQSKALRDWARRLIAKFDIKIAHEAIAVGTLSGGNLQKIVIARELAHDAPLLIAEQPTRGVDIGAIEFIHAELIRERDRGHAILLVSAELSEILALSDRILVMFEGRVAATLSRAEADEAPARPADGRRQQGRGMRSLVRLMQRAPRLLPMLLAVVAGFLVSGLIAASVGVDPLFALTELVRGAVGGEQGFETMARAAPLIGMTLSAALPFRGGMVNLGGDGQLVLGGFAAALTALYLPAPDGLRIVAAVLAAALAGGLYAALAACGEVFAGVPMLVSTWLLTYPAKGLCAYLVHGPLRDPADALPSTHRIEAGVRLGHLIAGTPVNQGFLLIAAAAALIVFFDRRTSSGYELRLRGLNERFARYGGVAIGRQAISVMFASGALAGLVGAILVLGGQYRFTDGALIAPQYTWSGTLAALLAGGEPVGAIVAGLFFAALQTGGFAMERSVEIPRVLTMVLESVIILFLTMGGALRKRSA
ncbi:MAG: ATP-binding cassette domain-containing protein [Aliidongia sp.]